jgi:hypothetical protein
VTCHPLGAERKSDEEKEQRKGPRAYGSILRAEEEDEVCADAELKYAASKDETEGSEKQCGFAFRGSGNWMQGLQL